MRRALKYHVFTARHASHAPDRWTQHVTTRHVSSLNIENVFLCFSDGQLKSLRGWSCSNSDVRKLQKTYKKKKNWVCENSDCKYKKIISMLQWGATFNNSVIIINHWHKKLSWYLSYKDTDLFRALQDRQLLFCRPHTDRIHCHRVAAF